MISFLQYNQHREFLDHALLVCDIYHIARNYAYTPIFHGRMIVFHLLLMFLNLEVSFIIIL